MCHKCSVSQGPGRHLGQPENSNKVVVRELLSWGLLLVFMCCPPCQPHMEPTWASEGSPRDRPGGGDISWGLCGSVLTVFEILFRLKHHLCSHFRDVMWVLSGYFSLFFI